MGRCGPFWQHNSEIHPTSLCFPTRAAIVSAFDGFSSEVVPMFGRTPFNNYLFVFKRASPGTTNV